jgi:hypothetical protein
VRGGEQEEEGRKKRGKLYSNILFSPINIK